jgi:SRSO17 transposase
LIDEKSPTVCPQSGLSHEAHYRDAPADAQRQAVMTYLNGGPWKLIAEFTEVETGKRADRPELQKALANLPAKTDLRTLAATIKARWICEQAHQQMKEELGLDHFEGRSWQGLHRHALMTMIAYAFLQHRRLAATAPKKKNQRAPASANLTRRAPRHPPPVKPPVRKRDV